jgi:two-component system, chemotaxis family, chemotaxis protein CheY
VPSPGYPERPGLTGYFHTHSVKRMNLKDLSIILVEPSLTQRRIIEQQLNELGITYIDSYTTGAEAMTALHSGHPDVVISSLYLPDMTGTDLVFLMRDDETLLQIAFMLISSETSLQFLDPIRQAGAVAILPKPFRKEDLRTALNATIDYLETPRFALEDVETELLQVLIVDDSSMSRNHLHRILEAMGIEHILEAADGAQGAALINEHFFDLVISDYNMPQMNGQELVDFIRRKSGQPGLPVLMVTSESNENRLAAVQQSGVSAICDKPFTTETIYRLLQQILQDGN